MMDEFVGINLKDTRTISTMLNFCFYLCVGQMNDAFQAIKYIKKFSFLVVSIFYSFANLVSVFGSIWRKCVLKQGVLM